MIRRVGEKLRSFGKKTLNILKMTEVEAAPSCAKRSRESSPTENEDAKRLKPERDESATKSRVKLQKYAMYVSFCGKGYFGMQINGDTPTIERELLNALFKCDLIDDEDCRKPGGKLAFQRAARTDKNVSAVKQICSLKLPKAEHENLPSIMVPKLNDFLPESIKIWGFARSTQGFNSKKWCDNRTYSYTLPTFAFANSKETVDESFRLSKEQLENVNGILCMFKGTRNFFNFTSGRKSDDKSCIRYVISCSCEPPFVTRDAEFLTVKIRGQSFMLHQIRKIIGLTIAVARGLSEKSFIETALSNKSRVDVPKAPGLGLVLEEVHFDGYNKRFEKTHECLSWEKYEESVQEFRRNFIDDVIIETEIKEKSMLEWLQVLSKHTYISSDEPNSPVEDDSSCEARN